MNKLSKFARRSIKNRDCEIFLWYEKDSDELVAQMTLENGDSDTWINSVFVSPRYRKQGLSYALLEVATVLGGTRLAVRKCNTKALHAYKKFGFEIFDENDKFYFMRLRTDIESASRAEILGKEK